MSDFGAGMIVDGTSGAVPVLSAAAMARRQLSRAAIVGSLAAAAAIAGSSALAEEEVAIAVHHGYGTLQSFLVEGRVAERSGSRESLPSDTWLANLWRVLRSLRVDEKKGVPLLLTFGGHTWELRSDEDGYFAMRGQTPPRANPGWQPLRVEVAGGAVRTDTSLLLVPDGEILGIISDVDDTVVVSEVADRSRLLEHTLLENPLQRRAVPGMAEFYRQLASRNPQPDATPVIYLTASPRPLLPAIRSFLELNGFPPGAIIGKKVTAGAGGDPLLDQERYKLERIEAVLADLPEVRFVLVGDDGERDPEVFRAIRERHPSRVEAVYVRRVSQDPARLAYEGQLAPP